MVTGKSYLFNKFGKNGFLRSIFFENTSFSTGFTLLELLIVIAILAILTTVVILVINPAEYLAQARDTKRTVDLANIDKALQFYDLDNPGVLAAQSPTVVYISLPDNSSTCSSYTLPTLPTGYTYHCVAEANLRKNDGTGWIPVDFTSISGGSPLSSLPTDPTNSITNRNYYSYVQGGSWELATPMESVLYKMGGGKDITSTDKGKFTGLYEKGTSYTLMPIDYGDTSLTAYWTFDENTGTTAYDYSGNNNTVSISGASWVTGQVNQALSFDGISNHASTTATLDLSSTNAVTVSFWLNWDAFSNDNKIAMEFGIPNYSLIGGFTITPNANIAGGKFLGGMYGDATFNFSYFNQPTAQVWHYYVFVMDTSQAGSDEIIAYVDGVQISYLKNYSNNNTNNFANQKLAFMSRRGEVNFGKGVIDDVKIYKKALTAAEVSALYNATK